MYDKRFAVVAWLVLFAGFNLFYFPMFLLGWMGMPRRYFDYLPQFASLQFFSSIGAYLMVAGLSLMFFNLGRGLRRGQKAPANPWGGATLEWQIPSPAPAENFEEIPTVTHGPYHFGSSGGRPGPKSKS
jgi:cytochrome c oxidase subunit 1